jgi:hypothetical protein
VCVYEIEEKSDASAESGGKQQHIHHSPLTLYASGEMRARVCVSHFETSDICMLHLAPLVNSPQTAHNADEKRALLLRLDIFLKFISEVRAKRECRIWRVRAHTHSVQK